MKFELTAFTVLSAFLVITRQETNKKLECLREENGARSLKLSLKGWKNSTGDWIMDVSAQKEISNTSRNLNVEVEHSIYECNGKTVVRIQGFGQEQHSERRAEKFLFNTKCGKNTMIINEGRSAFRLNPNTESGHGILLSSRPLNDNEVFEVLLEKKISKWGGNSMGIGVTSHPISSFVLPLWMMEVKSNSWMMYNQDIYMDGNKKTSNYGKNIATLEVGDRVGVMRSSDGEMHVYVNGVDQGVAATGIPKDVHGVVDIIRDFISVTIV